MPITVRSKDGEVRCRDAGEVWQGVRAGLVSVNDEVRVSEDAQWTKVADLPGGDAKKPRRAIHGYVRQGGSRRPRLW